MVDCERDRRDVRTTERDTPEALAAEIAELQREQRRLQERLLVFESIIDLTTASVFAKDLEGRYLFINPHGAATVGLVPADIVGRTDAELYDAEQTRRFRTQDAEVLASGRPVRQYMPVHTTGGTLTFLSIMAPLVGADGAPFGVAGIATDVTERARAEALLLRRTDELLAAQRIAKIGSFAWDTATDTVTASAEFNRILGADADRTWRFEELVAMAHPDDLEQALAALLTVQDGASIEHLLRVFRLDGSTAWVELRSAPSDTAGDAMIVGTIQDVTEREVAVRERADLETRLHRVQRLESVGQLAGGIAHDFNNLLAVIGIQAELARAELEPDHPAEEHLARHRVAVERAAALARQLLVFSRRERQDLRVIDLDALVDDVADLLRRTLGDDVELRVELGDEPCRVLADRSQVEQVLVNLAVNARDAMAGGGTLTIRTSRVPDRDGGPGRAVLTVLDTGVGMPPDVLERAFEPFFSTKPSGQGTGLGLTTVHEIVTRAGGDVTIRSRPGAGTRVDIRLPATDDAPTVPAGIGRREAGRRPPGHGERILVVEDNEPLAHLVEQVLRRAGYEPVVALGGDAALRAARDTTVDLLLTDVVMAHMSGREVADRLRTTRPALPVVYMSGFTAGIDVDDGDDARLLAKPFTPDELLDAVRGALAGTMGA